MPQSPLKLHLGYAGYCWSGEHHALRGGRRRKIRFYALWGLIEHPRHGLILYDTGYTPAFYAATKRWPASIYAKLTKVVINEVDTVKNQLLRADIDPTEIRHLILTHFHADHAGGLRDFPNATVYLSQAALTQVQRLGKRWAFTKGILPELLPSNLEERVHLVEVDCSSTPDPHFGKHYDLFDDGTIQLLPLPGHAAGQLGVRLTTTKQTYLLAADACWLREHYLTDRLPHPLVRLFFDSWSDFKQSLRALRAFHRAHPEVRIVPTHCQRTTDPLVSTNIEYHL
ncbi:MAG: MBL fold metallo-hydrolase [Bacteroidota bacterium]